MTRNGQRGRLGKSALLSRTGSCTARMRNDLFGGGGEGYCHWCNDVGYLLRDRDGGRYAGEGLYCCAASAVLDRVLHRRPFRLGRADHDGSSRPCRPESPCLRLSEAAWQVPASTPRSTTSAARDGLLVCMPATTGRLAEPSSASKLTSGSNNENAQVAFGTCCARIVGGLSFQAKYDWLATARLRLGYSFDRLMLYVTGGAPFTDVS